MAHVATSLLAALKVRVGDIERAGPAKGKVIPFGVADIDRSLPGHGLALGALHEIAGAGFGFEHGTAAARFVAGVLGRLDGPVLWVLERHDLFAPALAQAGLDTARVIFVEAGKPAAVLLAMEEGLRERGLAGVVGESTGPVSLTASRRLQLAAERSGVLGFALRRGRKASDSSLAEPSAAATRWRIEMLPSPPPLAHSPDTPGLGPARWRLELVRCRGGESAHWIVEECDATGRLRLVTALADRSDQETPRRYAAG